MMRSLRWPLLGAHLGAAAGLAVYGAAIPALIGTGVLERQGGSWTLHSVLLVVTIGAALVGARFTGAAGATALPAAMIGAGLSMFTWLEIDFHLLRVVEATTSLAETLLHAAGVAIACVGLALVQRSVPSTAGPSS